TDSQKSYVAYLNDLVEAETEIENIESAYEKMETAENTLTITAFNAASTSIGPISSTEEKAALQSRLETIRPLIEAREAIETTSYQIDQEEAVDEETVKSNLESTIAGLILDPKIDFEVVKVGYLEAVAGIETMPDGTDGHYEFTVELLLTDTSYELVTSELMMAIHATAYVEPTPTGTLLHSVAGEDFADVLYAEGGSLYYNQQGSDGRWSGGSYIAEGTDGKIALDSLGKIHVAFVHEGKIGYKALNSGTWSETIWISSAHGGENKWPDLAIDSSGVPHIAYVDTMGDTAGTTNHPDLMYAYLYGDAFNMYVYKSGSYDRGWKSGNYPGEKPPKIAIDENDKRYILYQHRNYSHDMYVYHDREIKVESIEDRSATSLGSVGSNTNRFDLYDINYVEGQLIALYRNGTEIKVGNIYADTSGKVTGNGEVYSTVANEGYSVDILGGDLIVAVRNSSNQLAVTIGEESLVYDELTVSAASALAVGGQVTILYDDSLGNIQTFQPFFGKANIMVSTGNGGRIHITDWPADEEIGIEIVRDSGTIFQKEWTTDTNGELDIRVVEHEDIAIAAGDRVLVKTLDERVVEEATIEHIEIQGFDLENDTVSGKSDAGKTLEVRIQKETPFEDWPFAEVTADAQGDWQGGA
ncbi:MAG TPA: hypothetical protein DHN33_00040, partial [Eubacteriaceae bacterium]|nr:hypothetical protein [Eubacteriaceae bacterium]